MKRMCRSCGVVFDGEREMVFCSSVCHNLPSPWAFRDQADAFNTLSVQFDGAMKIFDLIHEHSGAVWNFRKNVDRIGKSPLNGRDS